ncbi:MAG: GyrI-like domain-containing protein [bacterium]|nr:GyrI-like domain-containing protein [bacterium]
MDQSNYEIQEKILPAMWVAGVRMKGRYEECGRGFAHIGRALGRSICGIPFCLFYDGEFKENDADFAACMPVRKSCEAEGITVRELPGGRCVSLLYRGPYGGQGRAYEKLFAYIHRKNLHPLLPSREVYLKGPGMIFKGNPRNHLTEIQVMVE